MLTSMENIHLVSQMKIHYDIGGETSLLGTCLILPDKLYMACQALTPQHFYSSENQEIFRCLQELYKEGAEINLDTLASRAKVNNVFDLVSSELGKLKPSAASGNFLANLKNIQKNYAKSKIATLLLKLSENYDEINIRNIQKVCDDYFNSSSEVVTYEAKDLFMGSFYEDPNMGEWVENTQANYKSGKLISGLSTGFEQLDLTINGLNKGHYIIVAGIPGSGKTTFAIQMMKHLVQTGHTCAFITLEMIREQSAIKLISMETGIPFSRIQRGNFTDVEKNNLLRAIALFSTNKHLLVQDMQIQNLSSLRSRIKQLVEVRKAEVLFIDYLSLINNTMPGVNKTEQILEISNTIRQLLIELRVPGVIISQLNRSSTETSEAPKAHHMFGSSQIEKDAFEILMLHQKEERSSHRDLYIRKSRFGPRDEKLSYNFDNGIFKEISW